MAKIDWVVCPNYGVSVTAGPDELSAFPLYGLPDAATDDLTKVETADDWLVCLRIVGDVWCNRATNSQGDPAFPLLLHWRIMPLQCDWDSVVLQLPVSPGSNALNDQAYANIRWWDERMRYISQFDPAMTPTYELDAFVHPWWTHVDVSPKQAFGRNLNLWPAIVFWNPNPETVTVQWIVRLRLLCKYR